MIIAIPSDDKQTISPHFGRSRYFIVLEADKNGIKSEHIIDRVATQQHQGQAIGLLNDCDVVIAGGMGIHMSEDLAQAGVMKVLTSEADAQRAAELYLAGDLDSEDALIHGPGQGEHQHQHHYYRHHSLQPQHHANHQHHPVLQRGRRREHRRP